MIHNESFNVWSHALGVLLAVVLTITTILFVNNHSVFVNEIKDGKINMEFNELTKPIVKNLENLGAIP